MLHHTSAAEKKKRMTIQRHDHTRLYAYFFFISRQRKPLLQFHYRPIFPLVSSSLPNKRFVLRTILSVSRNVGSPRTLRNLSYDLSKRNGLNEAVSKLALKLIESKWTLGTRPTEQHPRTRVRACICTRITKLKTFSKMHEMVINCPRGSYRLRRGNEDSLTHLRTRDGRKADSGRPMIRRSDSRCGMSLIFHRATSRNFAVTRSLRRSRSFHSRDRQTCNLLLAISRWTIIFEQQTEGFRASLSRVSRSVAWKLKDMSFLSDVKFL